MKKPPALFIFGPTASGKTDLACFLVDSLKKIGLTAEIISVDSAMVYQEMDIGTAKPDQKLLKKYPHHLVDCVLPNHSFNAARFQKEALSLMEGITQKGHIPLLVGGTMLYFLSLLEGLNHLPCADFALRQDLNAHALKWGWPSLHAELKKVDEETAKRLSPNDSQRIQRALEVFYLTHTPLSQLLKEPKKALPFQHLNIGLNLERALLHERIAQRFEKMLDNGLVEEVRNLRQKYRLTPSAPSLKLVGYRQVSEALDGAIAFSELKERGIFATRQLAKRQLTWMKNRLSHEAFDATENEMPFKVLNRIVQFLENFPR